MTMVTALSRNDAALATPRHIQIGKSMGQLRTCNKRHKRAIRVLTTKAEATPATPPKSEKAAA